MTEGERLAILALLALLVLKVHNGRRTGTKESYEDLPAAGILNSAGHGNLNTFTQCMPVQGFYPISDFTGLTRDSPAHPLTHTVVTNFQDRLDDVRNDFNAGMPVIFFNNKAPINTQKTIYPNLNMHALADVLLAIFAARHPAAKDLRKLKVTNIVHDLGDEIGRVRFDLVLGVDFKPPQGMPDIEHLVVAAEFNYRLATVRARSSPPPTPTDRRGWYLNRLEVGGIDKSRFLYGLDASDYKQARPL